MGRVVVYARVVVCEDYLTNTLINTQRGVSPSPLARGTERVKHHLSPLTHEHTGTRAYIQIDTDTQTDTGMQTDTDAQAHHAT